jgi:hypothetical protein
MKVCIHPRRVVKVMREFLEEVSDLEYAITYIGDLQIPTINWNEEILKQFPNVKVFKKKCQIRKGKNFCAKVGDKDISTFKIFYNFQELEDENDFMFRGNFCEIYPEAENFESITLALLHELGHFCSQQEFEGYNRSEALKKLSEIHPIAASFLYFELPDEKSATDWAVHWLSKKENQILAKKFEEKFLSCFE